MRNYQTHKKTTEKGRNLKEKKSGFATWNMRKHNTSIKLAFSLKIWDEFYMFSVSYRAELLECVFVVSFSNLIFFSFKLLI